MSDKFVALWLSYSSMKDFQNCPRAYFLSNIYKNPQTGRKIQIVTPSLSIGSVVHEVIESISKLPSKTRFQNSLVSVLQEFWLPYQGRQGGFQSESSETMAKERAREMLVRVMNNPGPLNKPAIKLKEQLPFYWLSEEEEMILCGKLDWIEYLEKIDSIHIIDFKTSKSKEVNSLQLPIYALLASRVQRRNVSKISYWYLGLSDQPEEQELPDLADAEKEIMTLGKQIKLARKLQRFKCLEGPNGCRYCRGLERIVRGEGELVASNRQGRDSFILSDSLPDESSEVID